MIWYVDIEHEKALADPTRAIDFRRVREQRARVCAETSGQPCQTLLYQEVSWKRAEEQGLSIGFCGGIN